MGNNNLFPLSLMPIFAGGIVCFVLFYIFFVAPPEYTLQTWDEIFQNLIPVYLLVAVLFAVGNTVYIQLKAKHHYNVSRNLLYNMAGLILAIFTIAVWYVV